MAVSFNSIKLVKSGTIQGNDKAAGSITASDVYYPFGGSSDLWGLSLSDTDINASNFGVVFSFIGSGFTNNYTTHYLKATNFGFTIPAEAVIDGVLVEIEAKLRYMGAFNTGAAVDHIRITVYYTEEVTDTGNFFQMF